MPTLPPSCPGCWPCWGDGWSPGPQRLSGPYRRASFSPGPSPPPSGLTSWPWRRASRSPDRERARPSWSWPAGAETMPSAGWEPWWLWTARATYVGLAGTPQVVDLSEAVAGLPASGQGLDTQRARALAEASVSPQADIHASSSYRRHLAGVLTARALHAAASRAAASRAAASRASSPLANGAPSVPAPGELSPHRSPTPRSARPSGDQGLSVELVVNGVPRSAAVPPRRLLSDLLRHDLGLTGTHVGCEHGVCGCCTVLLDGRPVRSCLTLAATASGHTVTTVEGLAGEDGRLSAEQQAFIDCHGLQCGFCTPGFLMTVRAFLDACPQPTEDEAREAVAGNLCRCTGYHNIVRSVLRAAELRRMAPGGEPAPEP